MKQIASDPEITQMELAPRCVLSVAMVNIYMKRLCSTGLLEYRQMSSKCVSHHLTAIPKRQPLLEAQKQPKGGRR
ncbi:MAG: winged helix-turn-helix domain-containing protein [Acidobacteriia bacterium]|nr:winged helix-turn-helix domain-containing protein [Terriglobia bacterium]